jgi:hypothetical protein
METADPERSDVPLNAESAVGSRWWVVDVFVLLILLVLVVTGWSRGTLTSETSGDAFMALECGWRFLDLGFARPAQPLYGYGLCAMLAPLFVGAESLWDVALRRAVASGMYVPPDLLVCARCSADGPRRFSAFDTGRSFRCGPLGGTQ